MRDRHIPRLCQSCTAPMGRQEDTCWRCGAEWSTTTSSRPGPDPTAAALLGAEQESHVTAERWVDEGGTDSAPPARRVVVAAGV